MVEGGRERHRWRRRRCGPRPFDQATATACSRATSPEAVMALATSPGPAAAEGGGRLVGGLGGVGHGQADPDRPVPRAAPRRAGSRWRPRSGRPGRPSRRRPRDRWRWRCPRGPAPPGRRRCAAGPRPADRGRGERVGGEAPGRRRGLLADHQPQVGPGPQVSPASTAAARNPRGAHSPPRRPPPCSRPPRPPLRSQPAAVANRRLALPYPAVRRTACGARRPGRPCGRGRRRRRRR